MKTVTRFAPSPSGDMHLGHAFAAFEARRLADENNGEMRLRIEDIDQGRCDARYIVTIKDDLEYLGIAWEGEMMVQSERMATYQQALDSLRSRELIYPCYLSRRQLDSLLSAPHPRNTDRLAQGQAPAFQPATGDQPAWRLRMEAVEPLLRGLDFTDLNHGTTAVDFAAIGDEVIARKDIATSYHLSVVVDDAASAVTLITRGGGFAAGDTAAPYFAGTARPAGNSMVPSRGDDRQHWPPPFQTGRRYHPATAPRRRS